MLIVFLLTFLTIATPPQAQEPCKFSLIAARPQATSRGPEDVVQAVKVVDQPDSPLAITSLDLRAVTLDASPWQYTMEGMMLIEVMNVSDVAISRVELGRAAGWRDGYGSNRWSFGSVLGTGERRTFTLTVRSRGGTAFPDELTVAVGIDAAWIEECRYEPVVTAASVIRALRRQ